MKLLFLVCYFIALLFGLFIVNFSFLVCYFIALSFGLFIVNFFIFSVLFYCTVVWFAH
jgi:hypothetical protein